MTDKQRDLIIKESTSTIVRFEVKRTVKNVVELSLPLDQMSSDIVVK